MPLLTTIVRSIRFYPFNSPVENIWRILVAIRLPRPICKADKHILHALEEAFWCQSANGSLLRRNTLISFKNTRGVSLLQPRECYGKLTHMGVQLISLGVGVARLRGCWAPGGKML